MMNEENTQNTENPELVIPEFLTGNNNKKNEGEQKVFGEKNVNLEEDIVEKPVELYYIKNIPEDKKNWDIVRALDGLIGSIIANSSEPVKCNMNYNYTFMSDDGSRKENVKGNIYTSAKY